MPHTRVRYGSDFWLSLLEGVTSLTYEHPTQKGLPPLLTKREAIDALSRPQLLSKMALTRMVADKVRGDVTIVIAGGWVGVQALFLAHELSFDARQPHIVSLDKEGYACEAAQVLLDSIRMYELGAGHIPMQVVHADATQWKPPPGFSTIAVNTSCEHFHEQEFKDYIDRYPPSTLFILTSTNMNAIGHVRPAKDLEHFSRQCHSAGLSGTFSKLDLECNGWYRFFFTGYKELS